MCIGSPIVKIFHIKQTFNEWKSTTEYNNRDCSPIHQHVWCFQIFGIFMYILSPLCVADRQDSWKVSHPPEQHLCGFSQQPHGSKVNSEKLNSHSSNLLDSMKSATFGIPLLHEASQWHGMVIASRSWTLTLWSIVPCLRWIHSFTLKKDISRFFYSFSQLKTAEGSFHEAFGISWLHHFMS